ncbi:MAG: hypothetical protein Q8R48_08185 [Candidatus Omnitrophota bacterium]|nr:hypothetical protein [Candidatus Omnitrophota bacterium]
MFLLIHLIGAAATGIAIILSLISLAKKRMHQYPQLATSLGILSVVQLFSGTALTLLSDHRQSPVVFCSRLGLYLIAVFGTEYLLCRQMRKEQLQYLPLVGMSSSRSLGVIVSLVAYLL